MFVYIKNRIRKVNEITDVIYKTFWKDSTVKVLHSFLATKFSRLSQSIMKLWNPPTHKVKSGMKTRMTHLPEEKQRTVSRLAETRLSKKQHLLVV